MKIRSMVSYASTVAALASLPFLAPQVHAAPAPIMGQVSLQFGSPRPEYQSRWNDDQKKELRHIFYQLEHSNKDYDGHRERALREIRQAGEEMGMDLHGPGYAQQWQGNPNYGDYSAQPQSQEWSDNVLRHCHDRLKDLSYNVQDPVRHHLVDALRELDMALQVR